MCYFLLSFENLVNNNKGLDGQLIYEKMILLINIKQNLTAQMSL